MHATAIMPTARRSHHWLTTLEIEYTDPPRPCPA